MNTEPTPSANPSGVTIDPALAQLFAGSGIDPSALLSTSSMQPQQTQAELQAALLQAAIETSAPYGSRLPWWAQGLQDSLVSAPNFADAYKAGEGLVYLGQGGTTYSPGTPPNKFAAEQGAVPPVAEPANDSYALTTTQALNLPYTWDESEIADAMKRMKAAGLQISSFDDLVSAWSSLVNRAAITFQMTDGKRKVTPWDVLDMYKSEAQANGTFLDPNRTESITHRNVTEISEGEAWANIQSTLSQMLGRDPSDQETRDFTYRMNQMAASNPSISKTITQYKNGKVDSTSTHTDPGFTAADMAQEAYDSAQNEPDYAEYRSASYLFNAAMSALGPIGGE